MSVVLLLLLFIFIKFLGICNAGKVETNCGIEFKPNLNSQIVFGTDLTEYEHPWFCDFDILYDGISSHCSAVLISSEYILTAAHCFDESKLPQHEKFIKLRCGSVGNMINVKALKVIKHSVFADSNMHDIALIKIKEIRYTEYLRPICLMSYEKILEGSPVTVVGSGKELIYLSKEAKKAEITVKSLNVCTEIYGSWARSKENVLCAGTAITGIRGGDSGGPLMANFQGRYYLIGITSAKNTKLFVGTFLQNEYPVLFSRIAPECDGFIGNNSNVKCLKNAIPLRVSDEFSCGEISESRRQMYLAENKDDAILQPWYCKILDSNKNAICGGTLISFRHLLTAESCLENIQLSQITVKCGINFQITSRIAKFRKPPQQNIDSKNDDIAIAEFEKEINFDGNVGIACLTKIDILKAITNRFTVINQIPTKTMDKRSMNSATPLIATCQTKQNSNTNKTVVTCGKETSSLKGGPVLSNFEGKWHVVGVINSGDNNNEIINYTKVSNFCDFIEIRGGLKCSNGASAFHSSLLALIILILINIL